MNNQNYIINNNNNNNNNAHIINQNLFIVSNSITIFEEITDIMSISHSYNSLDNNNNFTIITRELCIRQIIISENYIFYSN